MDGLNQLSQQMDIVLKIKKILRANVAAKKYRFTRTFRVVENRLLFFSLKPIADIGIYSIRADKLV